MATCTHNKRQDQPVRLSREKRHTENKITLERPIDKIILLEGAGALMLTLRWNPL